MSVRNARAPLALRPHRLAVLVLVAGLVVTIVLSAAASIANGANAARLLDREVDQAAAALAGMLPATQATLVADYEVATATRASVAIFHSFNAPEVAGNGRFVSVSLWQLGGSTGHGGSTGGSARLVTSVGATPDIAKVPAQAAAFFAALRPSPQLSVTGILGPPSVPRLGYAELPPGSTAGLVVYAESSLPAGKRLVVPPGSAFSNLNFALYLGRAQRPADLLESSPGPSVSGHSASTSVPFGDTFITLVGSQRGPITGALSQSLAWIVCGVGILLALGGAMIAQGLVTRRQLAEGLAEENQRLYGEQRAVAATLQRALLPASLPVVEGVVTAARYVAGVDGIDVGGDWYDLVPLDDGHFVFVIGDVSGRGLGAATTMASLRYAVLAYIAQGDRPEVVLDKAGELLSIGRDGHFATAMCGLVDVAGRRISLANAGHLPALLVNGNLATYVEGPVGPPIGVRRPARSVSTTVSVPPRATVLVVTDGIVERRGENIDYGLERLRHSALDSVGGLGSAGALDEALGAILGELVPEGSDDDIAMLGIQWLS